MSELTKAQAVNRKIAELCGWRCVKTCEDWMADFYEWEYDTLVGLDPALGMLEERDGNFDRVPDYCGSLDAAVQSAGELLNYGLCIFLNPADPHITYKNGKRDEFGDLWTSLPVKSNDPADIAAAICEAILQACGVEVEADDGK